VVQCSKNRKQKVNFFWVFRMFLKMNSRVLAYFEL
jgi:hypothetical protein